jgi:pyrroloquinoline quinone biosynthesis protein B
MQGPGSFRGFFIRSARVKIQVLGSAAGGGFPQWNCNCGNCAGARAGAAGFTARTQSSIAVSGDGTAYALINASPDVRAQILATPALQPARSLRGSAIAGIVLIDAQIDHVTGLLLLRESTTPLQVYCTARVYQDLCSHFPVIPMLDYYCGVEWHEVRLDGWFGVAGVPGVEFKAVPLRSKPPPYSPHRRNPQAGDNIGLLLRDSASGHCAFYAPGLGDLDSAVAAAMDCAEVLLVDGTCWTDDELRRLGIGKQSARDMGHLPQSGPGGTNQLLAVHRGKRRVLIHINNTNPILDDNSAERQELSGLGTEVAFDGQLIEV